MATSSISGSSNVKDGIAYWEKTIKDVNDIDEKFANARDIGYVRYNYARTTAIGALAKYDTQDYYKFQLQSNGKLGISLRNTEGEDEKVLDLSKYEAELDKLRKITDPEGWAKEQEAKLAKEAEQSLLAKTAPGMQGQVYMIKNGREVLIADSTAEEGSPLRIAFDDILKGDYKAKKGNYYVRLSRDETVDKNAELKYALQIKMGDKFKHDYVSTEGVSSDTKNKKTSRVPSLTDYTSTGQLSSVNALQIQATKYQSTAQMLAVGYLNMASIYNKTSKY